MRRPQGFRAAAGIADPLVNLSDIATRSGLTRAAVHNYAKGERRSEFPAPVARITTGTPFWDWSEVAGWLYQHGALTLDLWQQALYLRETNFGIREERNRVLPLPADKKESA